MLKKSSILSIAFLEGFCVILIELASGRIVGTLGIKILKATRDKFSKDIYNYSFIKNRIQ